MTVKYNIVERGNPADPTAPKKFYPSIVSSGRASLDLITEQIANTSTVSPADVSAVLISLLTLIPQELSRGNVVELGDFGNFWLRARGEGSETAEEVRATQIYSLRPRFHPGKKFKNILDVIEFEKA